MAGGVPSLIATKIQNPTTTTFPYPNKALAAFTATLHSVGTNLEVPLRDRASNIQSNALALDRQQVELAENTTRLARQNTQWLGFADETRDGLKEIGDVQNWAELIERDLLALEDMMDSVEGRDRGSEDDLDRGGAQNGEVNVHVDGAVNGDGGGVVNGNGKAKKMDQPARSWFRWW
ncbi:GCN5-like 1 [Penicillium antarcticum]|uniref:GCN5-like 1 n=1 Tax=Penicillium antarcticum TaxID=416450 RepID=UPI0023A78CD6|nr:GCN5-like 1 [Penicillium antarcticum]KAJ5316643.1 GCN5-like 1 [Penicillium antarcticum]